MKKLKLIISLILMLTLCNLTYATTADILPPKGQLSIQNATLKDGKYFTSEKELNLNISASDNKTENENLKMQVSNKPLTGEELADSSKWINYSNTYKYTLEANAGDTTKIYVYLKDEAGNISPNVVESTKKFTITYVAEGAIDVPSPKTVTCGVPFYTSAQEPKMSNKYFRGWSLSSNATTESWLSEEIIEPKYISADATLYAVWGDGPKKLSEVVKIGDFVEYPVAYTNVYTNGNSNISRTAEWKVLDIEGDTVKLITAGTPLVYEKTGTNSEAIAALTTNFLNGTAATYKNYGFTQNLSEAFNNVYTKSVESIKLSDVTKLTGETNYTNLDVSDYTGTLTNLTYYYIAGEADSSSIYYVNGDTGVIGTTTGTAYGVRPVVTLSSKTLVTGRNNAGNWEIEMPSVEIILNDGTNITTKKVIIGETYGELPVPTKTGYTFLGWFTAPEGGTQITAETIVPETVSGLILYAHWEVKRIPSIANEPILGPTMKAVYWTDDNGNGETVSDSYPAGSYDYKMGDGMTDTKDSKWANAITTRDGSYWVWIPRYAYKITYYTDADKTEICGTTTSTAAIDGEQSIYGNIDILYMAETSNTKYRDINGNEVDLPEGYKVHPAFQKMTTESDLATNPLGKWDEELEGIWVAKYEAGMETLSDGTWKNTRMELDHKNNILTSSTVRMTSKPSAMAWLQITEEYMYTNSLNMHKSLQSHQMKNSEWGAVAYLTYSSYGRNGNTVGVNECISLYTGGGEGFNTTYGYNQSEFDTTYAWNTSRGKLASTTGNIYGIYDLAGSGYEYVASYVDNNDSMLTAYGKNLINSTDLKTKQIYAVANIETQENNYNINSNIYGDAVYETSITYKEINSWETEASEFPVATTPFFIRGGNCYSTNRAGVFFFNNSDGYADKSKNSTFRPVLCVNKKTKYQVTFDANGGTIEELGTTTTTRIVTEDYRYDEVDPNFPTAIKEGHTFLGWFTKPTGGVEIKGSSIVDGTASGLILYAQWQSVMDLIPSKANEPKLGVGMKAVYWLDDNGNGETINSTYPDGTYNYTIGDGKTDSRESKWANAITESDGSYWVWIPRYAYKITYTNETKTAVSENKTQYGNIDILYMYETSNTHYRDINGNAVELPEGYKVHPAFQEMTTEKDLKTNPLGKWDKEIEGIWVAKYEASKEESTDSGITWITGSGTNELTIKGTSRVVSKPSVQGWRNISVNYIYQNSLNMHTKLDSHQMKNSEWGAVAYLTQSAYGRNGQELAVNQCSNNYTGAGPGIGTSTVYNNYYAYNIDTFESTYAWNTTQGKLASTTGNIYGIYDMSGGLNEYTAAYLYGGENLTSNLYGGVLGSTTNMKTKQVYDGSSTDMGTNYNENSTIYGDAIYETSLEGTESTSWNNDYSRFVHKRLPFFTRGGIYTQGKDSGVFNYGISYGDVYSMGGFRPVLCIEEKATYEVTFNANGGNIEGLGATTTTRIVTEDNTYGEVEAGFPSAQKNGYTFLGWFTAEIGGEEITSETIVDNTAMGLILYAHWKEAGPIVSIANEPLLGTGMKAVYWTDDQGNGETTATSYPAGTYNYSMGDGKTDSKDSKWANAITESDQSYWVWVPRYAYKITYYTDATKTRICGTTTSTATIDGEKSLYGDINILFMYGISETHYRDINGNAVELPEGYKVHPSFQRMLTETDLERNPLGKWDEELTGIWVSKYDASRETSSDSGATWIPASGTNSLTSPTSSRVVSKPSVTSWRNITQSYIYQNSLNMHPSLNSHEMKNSEWGAVAYLAYSSYGRNGNGLAINQCSNYYTGGGPGVGTSAIYNSTYAYDASTFESTYAWNTVQGKLASTTGNIYGIYDMVGCALKYTASYINNKSNYLTNYGEKLVKTTDLKTKQVYLTGSSESQQNNYNANISVYGDAIYETSVFVTEANSWNSGGAAYMPISNSPFFTQGNNYNTTNADNLFNFGNFGGYEDDRRGFRTVLCVGTAHTVTYNANGGIIVETTSETTTRKVAEGTTYGSATYGIPEVTKRGFNFVGWYTEVEGGNEITENTIATSIVDGQILYAHWEVAEPTVVFNGNGGSFDTETTNTLKYTFEEITETKTSKTSNISDDGLTADTTTGYGNNKATTDIVTIEGAKLLEVTITYQTEGTNYDWISVYDGSVTPTLSNYNSSISGKLGGTTKTTKTFIIEGDTTQFFFKSDGSTCNYYGYYAKVKAIVTPVILEGEYKEPTRAGYEFMGWSKTSDATLVEFESDINALPNESTTLYAVWAITVTFDCNGGTITNLGSATTTRIAILGSKFEEISAGFPTVETRTGYTFIGWYTESDEQITAASIVDESLNGKTITAKWEITTYTISYTLNGGTVNGTNPTTYTMFSEDITLINPTKEGYIFTGWTGSNSSTAQTIVTIPKGATGNKSYTANYREPLQLTASIANEPVLGTGMKAVYWADDSGNGETTSETYPAGTYNYTQGNGITDTKETKWANAITVEDGSYWVWIPRYAYKITYYTNANKTKVSTSKTKYGDIDILFMYDKSNTMYRDQNAEEAELPEGYKVHPAFQAMTTETDLATNPLRKMG